MEIYQVIKTLLVNIVKSEELMSKHNKILFKGKSSEVFIHTVD